MDLNQLQYAPRVTRVSLGKCSSVDFVVLLLACAGDGGMAVKDIYAAYCAWRGGVLGRNGQDSRITYFFAREYGHISVSWVGHPPFAGQSWLLVWQPSHHAVVPGVPWRLCSQRQRSSSGSGDRNHVTVQS